MLMTTKLSHSKTHVCFLLIETECLLSRLAGFQGSEVPSLYS